MISAFTIRVYGILMNDEKNILVSDEIIRGQFYTKFPGGGLELGEGTIHCLIREFKEETGLDIQVQRHLYTTDFFMQSAFDERDQVLSIYYLVDAENINSLKISQNKFDFSREQLNGLDQQENFRWIPWNLLNIDSVTLPIDKKVVQILKSEM
ncbi:MAG: NUDIX domain-containing protein [Bacteroidetes bacterium]|nr:NUDIX domain-containing protein [Bacteroidota bacterium]